jgi:tryptophanyl-tRNA synthetase
MTQTSSHQSPTKDRVLTGDTPTGRLHLGHWVGSLENRVKMQDDYECYFLLANMHAFTTRSEKPEEIRRDTIEIVKDWLAAGIDPERSRVVLQTEVPAISEMTWYFAMLTGYGRLMRNPTIKTEIEVKGLGDSYSFGFLMYAIGQIADILAFTPKYVPVGEDQVPHIELAREAARRFNQLYCGVDPKTPDEEYVQAGAVFPIPEAMVGRVSRLVGIDGQNKMSKSLNNAIFLSDAPKLVQKKVNRIFTGRQSPTEPGDTTNALFQFVDAFMDDHERVAELKRRYEQGENIGDGEIKKELGERINALLEPMRERRATYDAPGGDDLAIDIIRDGTRRANATAEETLWRAKEAMKLDFYRRELR